MINLTSKIEYEFQDQIKSQVKKQLSAQLMRDMWEVFKRDIPESMTDAAIGQRVWDNTKDET